MKRLFSSRFLLPVLAVVILGLAACATPRQGAPLPEVRIGVTEFTQPLTISDMLAGYMAENTPRIPSKVLMQLNEALIEVLRTETRRTFADPATYLQCASAKAPGQTTGRVAAMRHWIAVGNCMNVDFLVVPQIMEFHEREGGEAGVTRPAGVVMNVFLIDVKNEVLASRSHYDETQASLADNLLDTGKFISRGGRWVTGVELVKEGLRKAIKDMGL